METSPVPTQPSFEAELRALLRILPQDLLDALNRLDGLDSSVLQRDLIEVVLDLGRRPQARFLGKGVAFSDRWVTAEDLSSIVSLLGPFSADNRAGIERTLHRIAAVRNRAGGIVGLTLRVGRAVFGTIEILRDLFGPRRNLLLLGRPGVGKTTKLREMARVLADDFDRRVIIIDTSNEIAGDGDVPHPAIGAARRMQVPHPDLQHQVMIEAVENHMPEVIIVDEIGTEKEAAAARTIAERGVQLIGTAHGTTLENLVLNPTVSDLVGGTHTVTLSDEEARRRRTSKTITERRAPPTFDIVVEMVDRDEVIIYPDTAVAVDEVLRGERPEGQRRKQSADGEIKHQPLTVIADGDMETEGIGPETAPVLALTPRARAEGRTKKIYAYRISRDLVSRAARELKLDAEFVPTAAQADVVLTMRKRARSGRGPAELPGAEQASIYYVKRETLSQIRRILQRAFALTRAADPQEVAEAMQEAEYAIQRVVNDGIPVALAPRGAELRRLQHQVISRHHLNSESAGSEPGRHLIVYP